MKIEKSYWNLIVKFYTDELSSEELLLLEKWKLESNENLLFFEQFKNVLKATDDSFSNLETNDDELWNKLQQRIGEDVEKNKVINFKPYFTKFSVAASVIFFLAIGSYFLLNTNSDDLELITIQTYQESREILLPDSSKVMLKDSTKLEYYKQFNNDRQLTLNGEAYFIVTKDTLHPFMVLTKSTITKVVGTEFNIRTDEDIVEIEVSEGIVEFGDIDEKEHSKLVKGESAQYNTKQKKLVKRKPKKNDSDLLKKIKKEVNKVFKKEKQI